MTKKQRDNDGIMNEHYHHLNLDEDEYRLLSALSSLQKKLANFVKEKYSRLNPFYEDMFSWKQRAKSHFPETEGITLYNSATVIGDVQVGNYTWIGPFTLIDGTGGLKIGKYCSISTGAQVLTHDTAKWSLTAGHHAYEYGATNIGDYCFIGTNAIITKGVTIGDHCLIAAGAVVVNDVPSFTIVGGVPAKVIGRVILNGQSNVSLEYHERS